MEGNDDSVMKQNNRVPLSNEQVEQLKFWYVLIWALSLICLAFFFGDMATLWSGFYRLLTSPANLVTDYFALANVGATFLNVGLMTLLSLIMVRKSGAELNGVVMAALFTVMGFAFFGKNLFNSLPITLGVYLAARFNQVAFKTYIGPALFGSAMGPFVSEIAFDQGLPMAVGLFLGSFAGIVLGFILPPLAESFKSFHRGYNLYNIGFTAGIITMCMKGLLEALGMEIHLVSIISAGHNEPMTIVLSLYFAITLILGLALKGGNLSGYIRLLRETGQGAADFIAASSFPVVLINMSLLGYLSMLYVLLLGGELNGPAIGGVLTVVGFAAAGKHLKNVYPIMVGVFLAKLLNQHDLSSTSSILVALFGTTLAPIAGRYGVVAGIAAGFFHMLLATNISIMHGGMNLYNNGFAAGFIAAFMVPVLDFIIARYKRQAGAQAPLSQVSEVSEREEN